MQNDEKVNNIESQNETKSPESNSEKSKKPFRSKYTALISLLNRKLTPQEYKKEVALIKNIIKIGYTELQLYRAWKYYNAKSTKFDSFAVLLWNKCKLMKDIQAFLDDKNEAEKFLIEKDKDYRTNKDYTEPPQSKFDFLK